MIAARSVVLVAPIVPAATGNGLAMRAGMLLEALAVEVPVHVVVIPVSGPADDLAWAAARASSLRVVAPVTGTAARDHITRQLAHPELRARLERTIPLPSRATGVPPTLATEMALDLPRGNDRPSVLVALRTALAPCAITLGHSLDVDRVVVDADDDDVALLHSLGAHDEAEAFDRLIRCWLPEADLVVAASTLDADGIAARTGVEHLAVIPNCVAQAASVGPPPRRDRLLFVGNLTYEPNRIAARILAEEILPLVRSRCPDATLDLVGPCDDRLLELSHRPGVRISGWVDDVSPHYAEADVVVAPLRQGAGTRIKILEAFAHQRPVVATPTAVAGLAVRPGRDALIAEAPQDLAAAVVRLLRDRSLGAALVESATDLWIARYTPAVVGPIVRAAILRHAIDRSPVGSTDP